MFRVSQHPSSGVLKAVPEAAGTVFNTPDDGCCDNQNKRSSFAVNKYLHSVASVRFLFISQIQVFVRSVNCMTLCPHIDCRCFWCFLLFIQSWITPLPGEPLQMYQVLFNCCKWDVRSLVWPRDEQRYWAIDGVVKYSVINNSRVVTGLLMGHNTLRRPLPTGHAAPCVGSAGWERKPRLTFYVSARLWPHTDMRTWAPFSWRNVQSNTQPHTVGCYLTIALVRQPERSDYMWGDHQWHWHYTSLCCISSSFTDDQFIRNIMNTSQTHDEVDVGYQ